MSQVNYLDWPNLLFVPLVTLLCNLILEVYSELCSLEGCRKAMLVLNVDFSSAFPLYYPDGLPLVGVFISWIGFCYAHSTYKVLICLAKWCSCCENLFLLVFVWSFPHKLTLLEHDLTLYKGVRDAISTLVSSRKVRRLTRHPFRETSKSELYFLPRSFEQKTYWRVWREFASIFVSQ